MSQSNLKQLTIPGIGAIRPIGFRGVPSNLQVLKKLFAEHHLEKNTIKKSSALVAKYVCDSYHAKGIPTQREWLVKKKICGLYQSWRSLQKNFKKAGNSYDNMRDNWTARMKALFDVTHQGKRYPSHVLPPSPQMKMAIGKNI